MNDIKITSAQYMNDPFTEASNAFIKVVIDNEESIVPLDPDNRHYAEIMRQVDAGELTIAAAD